MNKLKIIYKDVSELRGYENNSRTHSPEQITQIKKSIDRFGFTNPLLIQESGTIIAGHGRLMASLEAGLTEVPVIVLKDLTEVQIKELVIADNKLALNAGFDFGVLKSELENIIELGGDTGITGFDEVELGDILGLEREEEPQDNSPEDVEKIYELVIECSDEMQQEDFYTKLTAEGYKCRVLSM